MNGDTVLVAQFPGPEQTKRASMAYHRSFQLHNTFGDEAKGWRATRMQGDFIEMLRTDYQLFVWTGLTKEAASARRAASRLESQFPSFISAPRAPLIPALQPLAAFFTPLPTKLCGMIFLIGVYIFWFFKGATWASSSPPTAGTPIATASELTSRLLAINQSDTPFTLVKGNSPQEFIADWRYADAKWINLARVHGMKRTFRIRLTLDESSRSVRATDYVASFDWSAGGHSASIEWQAATGIIFFQREQHRALGLQIDERGRPSPSLGHQLKFDLNELKAPIINAVTKAGWSWRPTVWQCPSWLRRLTSTPKLSP
jgi:hypothetical protein